MTRQDTLEYWSRGDHTALTSARLDTSFFSPEGCGHEIAGTFSAASSSGPGSVPGTQLAGQTANRDPIALLSLGLVLFCFVF